MKIPVALFLALLVVAPASAIGGLIKIDLSLASVVDAAAKPKPIASTSVVAGAGQKTNVTIDPITLSVTANADDAGVITTAFVIVEKTTDEKNLTHTKTQSTPTIKTLSGKGAVLRVEGYQIDLLATVVEQPGFSFDFPGGTVEQLLATVAKGDNPTFNLIGTKEQLALPLPAFSLRSANASAFAAALDNLLQPRGVSVAESSQNSGPVPVDSPTKPIFVIRSIPPNQGQQGAFECFPLAPLLDRYTPEQIASAIQTAWDLDPNFRKETMQLKYHPETQLLFVVGNPPQSIAAASQIYRTLLHQQKTSSSGAPPAEKKP